MKRKYYKYTPEYMERLRRVALCPMGCERVKYASHRKRKDTMYRFGEPRPHHKTIIYQWLGPVTRDVRKARRLRRKNDNS